MIKLIEIIACIALGFFSGILLSGNGIHISESGIHILLGCIFWALILIYLKLEKK
ncbi:hypothetical protein PAECIP111893_03862 [Paenibacillus plantiphilus]|uniref:DUF1328 domain-containing protein n=1 Tax=Paenibacillus plantiphilus TaxID=2905650 RepID=A0ABN8GU49_9BACL|nr:hypothetical protein [Paenibacillus plantiphilus]CAH1214880.1 hypothetical protein PAECIP111893_03862 [Paenibacillus plantiphilus]